MRIDCAVEAFVAASFRINVTLMPGAHSKESYASVLLRLIVLCVCMVFVCSPRHV